jgi:hypothetical protein
MKRAGFLCVIVAVLFAAACGGNDEAAPSPTAPTPTTPPVSTPPPASTTCAPPAPANPPPAPANLAVVQTASSTRVFTWNASATAADYFIGIGSSSGNADLIYTNTSQTTYSWTGAGVTSAFYYARVYARNSCGSSAWSTELAFH